MEGNGNGILLQCFVVVSLSWFSCHDNCRCFLAHLRYYTFSLWLKLVSLCSEERWRQEERVLAFSNTTTSHAEVRCDISVRNLKMWVSRALGDGGAPCSTQTSPSVIRRAQSVTCSLSISCWCRCCWETSRTSCNGRRAPGAVVCATCELDLLRPLSLSLSLSISASLCHIRCEWNARLPRETLNVARYTSGIELCNSIRVIERDTSDHKAGTIFLLGATRASACTGEGRKVIDESFARDANDNLSKFMFENTTASIYNVNLLPFRCNFGCFTKHINFLL